MKGIKLTKIQRQLALTAAMVVVVVFVFTSYVVIPLQKKSVSLKAELSSIEGEIADIKRGYGKSKTAEGASVILRKDIKAMEFKFPAKEEIILKELSDLATRNGIEVIYMKPKKTEITEMGGKPIDLDETMVTEMSISMSMKAPYKRLGNFLIYLYESFPVFVRVDNAKMKSSASKTPWILDVELNLTSYLLSRKGLGI